MKKLSFILLTVFLLSISNFAFALTTVGSEGGEGTLKVTIVPKSTATPSVKVKGPAGFGIKTVMYTTQFDNVPAGRYSFTLLNTDRYIEVGSPIGGAYYPILTPRGTCIENGITKSAKAYYKLERGSKKLWTAINAYPYQIAAFAGSVLTATGTQNPAVLFDKLPVGTIAKDIAFDSKGNMWAAYAGSGIAKYSRLSIGYSKEAPLPRVKFTPGSSGSLSGMNKMVFDRNGHAAGRHTGFDNRFVYSAGNRF